MKILTAITAIIIGLAFGLASIYVIANQTQVDIQAEDSYE